MGTDFDGLHTVVTGGTGALGFAVVSELLEQGATCHVPCFHIHELEQSDLRDHERVSVTPGIDLRHEIQAVEYFASLPRIRASIHTVGGFAMASLADTSLEAFDEMWQMNVVTCFLSCREAVRNMRGGSDKATKRRSEPGGGRIVNVAARPALAPVGGMVAYTTAKAAVASLTQNLAEELKSEGIAVNAVAPSIIDTPANRQAMPDADHSSWPNVADLAIAVANLASPRNTLTSGAIVPVYGRA